MKMNLPLGAAMGVIALAGTAGANFLMIPDSTFDRVVLLSAQDGSLVNGNFLDVAAAAASVGYTGTSTPIEAIEVGSEIWVTDQVADRIWRFNSDGTFAGQIGVDPTNGQGTLNNIRGIEVVGNTAYVAQGSDGASVGGLAEGIITIDTSTNAITGSFIGVDPGDASYWDVKLVNGELYVTNSDSGNDSIQRYATDGTFLGNFASSDGSTDFDFAQQMNFRQSNGNLLVGGFSPPAGVYEFQLDGTPLGIVGGLNSGPRAAYELGDGTLIWTNGSFVASGDAGDENVFLDGGNFRFITPTTIPSPGALALLGGAGLVAGRRRRA